MQLNCVVWIPWVMLVIFPANLNLGQVDGDLCLADAGLGIFPQYYEQYYQRVSVHNIVYQYTPKPHLNSKAPVKLEGLSKVARYSLGSSPGISGVCKGLRVAHTRMSVCIQGFRICSNLLMLSRVWRVRGTW